MQRDHPSQIRIGDAAVFFQDVKGNDPDRRAKLKADHKTYDTSTGSQAHHIALVSDVWWSTSDDKIELEIAESSGTISQSGGNGVHVRSLGDVQSYVSNKLVYCRAGNDRIYFVASAVRNPYLPDTLEDTAMPEDVLG
jgi:hypothetical protein